jgi:hypothetical protein
LLGARWKLNANNHRKAHVPFGGLFRGFAAGSVLALKRTMDVQEPILMNQPGAHDEVFRVGLPLHRELANGFRPTACIERAKNIRQRQLPELPFDPR